MSVESGRGQSANSVGSSNQRHQQRRSGRGLAGAVLTMLSVTTFCVLAGPVGAQTAPPSYTRFDTGVPTPVLSGGAGAWDQTLREKVSVIQEGTTFKMWYVGHSSVGQSTSHVGYATSTDGINWVKYAGNPVVSRASQDQDVCVVKAPDGSYYMYLEVNDDYLDLLTSADGLAWTPYAGNPIRVHAASPVVWREGTSWFMLYEDMAAAVYNIRLATSGDGRTWIDSATNPVLFDSVPTVPDSIVKEGSTYHLYYHREEPPGWPTWHATSTDLATWSNRTRLFANFTSQATFRFADGRVFSYMWNLVGDGQYYLRYGRELLSPTIWHFDEGSGTTTVDSSGNGADATLLNGTAWITAQQGAGLSFDGTNDYAVAGYWANLANWSVSAWVKSPAAPANAAASGPVHREQNLQIVWNHPSSTYRGAAVVSVGGRWYAAKFGSLQANTWYHLAATYDGETLRAYRDGQLMTANTAPSGPADPETEPLNFGRHAGAAQYFRGSVDEVRIYDRALTQTEIAVLAQRDATPPTAATLSGSASGQAATLSWTAATDPDSGIGAYRVYRGTVQAGTKALLAEVSGATLTYRDSATAPFTTYYYQVAAVNGGGLEGTRSNEIGVTTGNTPPTAPTGLTAVAGNSQTALGWSASPESDVVGYFVYRSTTNGGPYAPVTTSAVTTTSFTDIGLTNGVTYYYVVSAVDNGGAESPASTQAQATPTDIDPSLAGYWQLNEGQGTTAFDSSGNGIDGTLVGGPAWTAGRIGGALSFDGVDDHVSTSLVEQLNAWTIAAWVRSPNAPTSAPSAGPINREKNFQISWNHEYPSFQGAAALSVRGQWYAASFGTLAANTWYQLTATYDGETLRSYRNGILVTANGAPSGPPDFESLPMEIGAHAGAAQYFNGVVDDVRIYRRVLSASEVAALAQPDSTPPSAVALSAGSSGQTVALAWTAAADAESGIGGYKVYRGTVAGGSKNLIATVSGGSLSFQDNGTAPSTTYYYQVAAVNGGGLEGARSNEAAALTGNTPPSAPTGLAAVASNGQIALDWNDGPEADLAGYRVYRGTTSGGPYTLVTASLVGVSAFTDTGLANGTPYFYVVTAVDTGAAESSYSAQVQGTPTAIDPSMAAFWPLDDAAGLTATDVSGNGMNGTLVNGPAWTTGRIGGALSFDGVNDYVSTNFTEQLNTWTVAAWVWSPAAPTFGAASGPVNRDKNLQIVWNHPYPNFQGTIALSVGGQWYSASLGPLTGSRWYHIAGTYDGETLNAYVDGVLVTANTAPSGSPDAESLPLRLGAHAAALQFFTGGVDDVRVYRRALTAAEIAALAGR